MRRVHAVAAICELDATTNEWTEQFGASPLVVGPGEDAFWRTPEVNLSVNGDVGGTYSQNDFGIRSPRRTCSTDVNGRLWEAFNPDLQALESVEVYRALSEN
jgi:hypothetical protein